MSDSGHSPPNMDIQQQQHVSPDRWSEEAELLNGCIELTADNSKFIEQEIEDSPLCSTIYSLLNELFNEEENNLMERMEITGNRSGYATRMEHLDDLLDRDFLTSLDEVMSNCSIPEYDEITPNLLEEYNARILQIRSAYKSEYEKLQGLCEEYVKGMVGVFSEQPHCIPISVKKIDEIIHGSRVRSQLIFQELKTNVDEAVRYVRKNMFENRTRRKRKNFSKQATEILNEYFYSHLENPYPSEEVKADLAIQCNINTSQVSNWFGNKRIRYKRNIGKEPSDDFDMDQKLSPMFDSEDMLDDPSLEGISTSDDDDD